MRRLNSKVAAGIVQTKSKTASKDKWEGQGSSTYVYHDDSEYKGKNMLRAHIKVAWNTILEEGQQALMTTGRYDHNKAGKLPQIAATFKQQKKGKT